MVKFRKTVARLLPYNRTHYMRAWRGRKETDAKWYGYSFQLDEDERTVSYALNTYKPMFIDIYQPFFEEVVLSFGSTSRWIINHDNKDMAWLPNNENNLQRLRSLFKSNNVPFSFKGGLEFDTEDLLLFSKELMLYPTSVFNREQTCYKNLDISNKEIPFIIKTTGHLDIDLLSTDKGLLEKFAGKKMKGSYVIQYRTL